MTDQQTISSAVASQAQSLSPEAQATLRQAYGRAGYTADQINGALGPTATPAQVTRSPLTADVAGKITVSASESSGAAAYLEAAAAKGWLTGEAKATFEAMKSSAPKTAVVPSKADPFVPGTKPEDYPLRWPYRMRSEGEPGALQSADAETRVAFASAQVPISHSQPLLDALTEASALIAGKNTAELEMHDQEIARQVGTILGEGAFEKAAAVARSFGPKAFERLKATGAFRSVQAIVMLNSVADAIAFRKSKS